MIKSVAGSAHAQHQWNLVPSTRSLRSKRNMKGQVITEYVIAVGILSLVMLSLPYLLDLLAQYQGSQAAALTAVFL